MRGATRALVTTLVVLASCSTKRTTPPSPSTTPDAAVVAPLVTRTILTPIDEPDRASSPLALAKAGARRVLLVADEDDRRLRVVSPAEGVELATTKLEGTPGHVVVDRSGLAWVTLRDSDLVVSFGLECGRPGPQGAGNSSCVLRESSRIATPTEPLALAVFGNALFVACAWGHKLVRIDLATRRMTAEAALAREPRALLPAKDGKVLLVAHATGSRVSEAEISEPTAIPVREYRLDWRDHAYEGSQAVNDEPRSASQGFTIARAGERVLVPMVLAYTGDPVPSKGYGSPREDTFFPHETMIVSLHDPPDGSPARLRSRATVFAAEENRISAGRVEWPHDLPPCLLPRAAAPATKRGTLLVACLGTNQLVEIDASEKPLVQSMQNRWRVPGGPVAIAVDEEAEEAFIWSMFERSLARIALPPKDAKPSTELLPASTIPIAPTVPLDATWARGREIFHRPSAFDGRACASCHPDARTDGLTWASPAGGLSTPMLAGRIAGTAPYGWLGDGPTVAHHLRETMVRLKGKPFNEEEIPAIVAYITSARTYLAPRPKTPLEERGKAIFASAAAGCTGCHLDDGRKGDGQKRDVGTGLAIDTPSLRFLDGTAPYMHDGRYATLREVLSRTDGKMGHTAHLAEADVQALIAYLKAIN